MSSRRAALILLALALALALAPMAAGADADDGEGVSGLEGERSAVPLSAPTPAWYDDALHDEVLAAGAEGVPLPAEADVPASALAFQGIRPGAWMITPAWCTMNFVFDVGRQTGKSIGTAGHCTEPGDEVVLVMAPGVLVYIGDTSKSVDQGIGRDFALVDIRPEVVDLVNPSMAIVAGPTSTGEPGFGDAVLHVGHGVAVGTGGTPRAGVVTYTGSGDGGQAYGWDGAAAPGDSGSAVRDANGEAVGNLTHLVVGGEYVPAIIAGTTAAEMERIAGGRIATASLVPDPLP
jgi:hypothetical protein